jgi:hypothetical protein
MLKDDTILTDRIKIIDYSLTIIYSSCSLFCFKPQLNLLCIAIVICQKNLELKEMINNYKAKVNHQWHTKITIIVRKQDALR